MKLKFLTNTADPRIPGYERYLKGDSFYESSATKKERYDKWLHQYFIGESLAC